MVNLKTCDLATLKSLNDCFSIQEILGDGWYLYFDRSFLVVLVVFQRYADSIKAVEVRGHNQNIRSI